MTRQSCDRKTPFKRLSRANALAMTWYYGQIATAFHALAMTDEGRNDAYAPKNKPVFIVKHNIINVLYCAKLYRLNQG